MITWGSGLMMFCSAIAAGIVQSVTGFGAGIVMMVFIPYFLPLLQGATVSTLVSISMQVSMIITYRKHIRFDYMWKPAVFYFLASSVAVKFAVGKDVSLLKAGFGVFLIILAVYFLLFSDKLKLKANWGTAGICGSISGVASGIFGIGGPPMVLYFLALTGADKLAYLGTIQTFFTVTSIYTTALRVVNGIFTWQLIPFVLCGTAGIIIGKLIGTKIVAKINADTMRKLVYAFMAFAGFLNVVNNI